MGKYNNEVGIRYEKVKLDNNTYLLVPIEVIIGYSVGDIFYSDNQHKILNSAEDLTSNNSLVDKVYTIDELKNKYLYFEADNDFIREFFYEEEKTNLVLIQIKDGKILKRDIPIEMLTESKTREIYQKVRDNTIVTLNKDSVDNLLNIEDIGLLKKELGNLKRKLLEFENIRDKKTKRIVVEDGHVKEIEMDIQMKPVEQEKNGSSKDKVMPSKDITLRGLEAYIKERVFGHDEMIKRIAKTLIMNYTATGNEKRESILLVGPTGVGKTETVKAAAEYLGVPFVDVNTINLVPQGIKGESLEDYMYSLLVQANYDLGLAQKGVFFLDEFDKLGRSNTDYKQDIKDIMLKFIEGCEFTLDKSPDNSIFNTYFLNKVFAGRFDEVFEKNRVVGFGADTAINNNDMSSLLSKGDYYGKELVTRIMHIYFYQELSRETKKRIILYSKLSEYLEKKLRYERQFGVSLEATDSYVEALLETLAKNKQSIRELNNLVSSTLDDLEYELLTTDHSGSRVILTSDIVEDNRCYKIV